MVSTMMNIKRYIFLMLKIKHGHHGFHLRRLSSDDYIHSFPSTPSLRGKLKMNRVEGGRKNPEEKASFYGMEGGAAGKWLGLGPLKQEEVSLPCRPPPSGLLSGCWLQFCSPWHSFPLESRSGPPSPEGLSQTSFSVPLTPMGVNIYRKSRGTLKAQKPRRTSLHQLDADHLTSAEKWAQGSRDSSPPDVVPTDRGRRAGATCWQRPFNQHGLGSRMSSDVHGRVGVWADTALLDLPEVWTVKRREDRFKRPSELQE